MSWGTRITGTVVVLAVLAGVIVWLDGAADPGAASAMPGRRTLPPSAVDDRAESDEHPRAVPDAATALVAAAVDDAEVVTPGAPPAPVGPRVVLRGRLVTPDGRGVPGARVALVTGVMPQLQMRSEPDDTAPHATSDVDGRFALDSALPDEPATTSPPVPGFLTGVLGGRPRLTISHEAFVSLSREPPRLHAGVVDMGVIELSPAARVVGRVLAPDGAVVTDAQVAARPADRTPGDMGQLFEQVMGAADDTPARTRTSTDGRFSLGGLAGGRFDLIVAAEGSPTAISRGFDLEAGLTLDVGDLRLEPGLSLAGVVLDEGGRPAADVPVRCDARAEGLGALADVSTRELLGDLTRRTLSDSDGSFTISGLGPGSYGLTAGGEGWSEDIRDDVAAGTTDIVLTCGRLGELLVTVRSSVIGEELQQLRLHAEALERPGRPLTVVTGDELGALLMSGTIDDPAPSVTPTVKAGTPPGGDGQPPAALVRDAGREGTALTVSAAGHGRVRIEGPPVLDETRVPLTVELPVEARVAGRVVSALDDTPLPGAAIELRREPDDAVPSTDADPGTHRAEADEQGRFDVGGLGPGRWAVSARHDGSVRGEPVVIELEQGVTRDDLALALWPGGAIQGRVTETRGAPVVGARLVLTLQDGDGTVAHLPGDVGGAFTAALEQRFAASLGVSTDSLHHAVTDDDGAFLVTGLAPGTWAVELQREGASPPGVDLAALLGASDVDPDRTRAVPVTPGGRSRADFVRAPRSGLTVRVLAAGRVAEGARVALSDRGKGIFGLSLPSGGRIEPVDAEGYARYAELEPGDYTLRATVPGASHVEQQDVTLAAGAHDLVELAFGGGAIEGRVIDGRSGAGVAGVQVSAEAVAPPEKSGGLFSSLFGSGTITVVHESNGSRFEAEGGADSFGLQADRVTTDAEGRFVLRFLRGGDWRVQAQGGPWLPGRSDRVNVTDGGEPATTVVTVERGVSVRGVVVQGSTEEPLDGLRITLEPVGAGASRSARTDAGAYAFEAVPPGDYRLTVEGGRGERRVTVAAGEDVLTVDLVTFD